MHIWANQKALLASVVDGVPSDLCRGLAHRILCGFEHTHVFIRKRSPTRYIQAHHRHRNSRLEDDSRRLGIDINVELSRGRDVSA